MAIRKVLRIGVGAADRSTGEPHHGDPERPPCGHGRHRPLCLGRFFGTSGEFWLNLQKLYELRRAERDRAAEIGHLPTLAGDGRLSASG